MLGGNAEFLLQGTVFPILLKNRLILAVELLCVQKELRPVVSQGYSSSTAIEQYDPQFFFQLCTALVRDGWETYNSSAALFIDFVSAIVII